MHWVTQIGNLCRRLSVSGSQGSGKSTFAGVVVEQLQMRGFAAAAVSLDDFYLTHADRQTLGATVHRAVEYLWRARHP